MGNLPLKLGNLPAQLGNYPHELGNLPHQLGNLPRQLGNLPHQLGNLPHQLGNLPLELGNHPLELGNHISEPKPETFRPFCNNITLLQHKQGHVSLLYFFYGTPLYQLCREIKVSFNNLTFKYFKEEITS
jgi:hypothetical protein